MSKLVIVVPADRRRCGRALLLGADGSTRLGPIRVLATSSEWAARRHGNESRDWRRPFGHPPAGSYVVGGSLPPGVAPRPKRLRRFGGLGALVLMPVEGNALEAARAGRRRFLLHGGPKDERRRLRPTFGGFRISNRELAALLRAVNEANAASDPVSSVEVVETTSRPPWTDDRPRDRAGRLRPGSGSRRRRARNRLPLEHAALIALGFGVGGKRLLAEQSPGRRGFVGLALLTLGALGATACSSAPDAPSPEPSPRRGASPAVGGPDDDPPDGSADGGGDDGGYANEGGGAGGGGCCSSGGYAAGNGGVDVGGGGDDTGDDSSGGAG